MTSNTQLNLVFIFLILNLLHTFSLFPQEEIIFRSGQPVHSFNILSSHYQFLTRENTASACMVDFSFVTAAFGNQFLLKELMEKNVSSFFRIRENILTVQMDHFGYSRYGDIRLSGGYGRLFGQSVAVGMRFHYLLNHAYLYPARHSFTFDLSFQALIARKYGIGVMVYNPAKLKYGFTGRDIIPMQFNVNVFYLLNDRLLLWGKMEKELPGGFDLSIGISRQWKMMILNGSISLTYFSLSGKVRWGAFEFEIQSKYHYRLGFSPALAIHYLFKS